MFVDDQESYAIVDEDGKPIFVSKDATGNNRKDRSTREYSLDHDNPHVDPANHSKVQKEEYKPPRPWFRGSPPKRSPHTSPEQAKIKQKEDQIELLDI